MRGRLLSFRDVRGRESLEMPRERERVSGDADAETVEWREKM